MKSYSFHTIWKLRATAGDVWALLMLPEEWPQWWKGVQETNVIRKGDATGKGSITFYRMGNALYSLKFMMKVVDTEPFRYIKGIAEGDLIGTGVWELQEADGIVTVKYHWNVETTLAWMNRWAWLLRPFFHISHNFVMRNGGKGLAKRLGTELL